LEEIGGFAGLTAQVATAFESGSSSADLFLSELASLGSFSLPG